MNFDRVGAVFEFIGLLVNGVGEFSGFSDEASSGAQGIGEGGRKDEATGFDADDHVDVVVFVTFPEMFDRFSEDVAVGEKGSDIHELDSLLGEVAHRSYAASNAFHSFSLLFLET